MSSKDTCHFMQCLAVSDSSFILHILDMRLFLMIIFNGKHWKQATSRIQVLSRENKMLEFQGLVPRNYGRIKDLLPTARRTPPGPSPPKCPLPGVWVPSPTLSPKPEISKASWILSPLIHTQFTKGDQMDFQSPFLAHPLLSISRATTISHVSHLQISYQVYWLPLLLL